MTWSCLSEEIAELFERLSGHVDWKRLRLYAEPSFLAVKERERTDATFRAQVSETRERKRRTRIAADPLYAERYRTLQRAAQARRKQRLSQSPELLEAQRAVWRESKRRRKEGQ